MKQKIPCNMEDVFLDGICAPDKNDELHPVIVMLDSQKVMDFIYEKEPGFIPNTDKIDRILDELEDGDLRVPIFIFNNDILTVADGRHRSAVIHADGMPMIPFVAAQHPRDPKLR